ncbi:MAG: NAD(P)-dependent oxidoreductase [Chloroflexota bacterium]|nr:NAD(P)-dependent oxidoreductase [Chloroflexota bacterium]
MEQTQVLLTGGASRLGAATAAALMADGHAVRSTDTIPPPAIPPPVSLAGWGDFRQGALTDADFVASLLEGFPLREESALPGAGSPGGGLPGEAPPGEGPIIVHLAPLALLETMPADAPAEILDAAARGTHVLLKAAVERGVRHVVQGSTLAVMDAYHDDLEVDEQWRPRPRPDPAEMAPYLAELTAREFTRDVQLDSRLSVICLRFADPRALSLADAVRAVQRALIAFRANAFQSSATPAGSRQQGRHWQVYHISGLAADARYTSALAQRALGYAVDNAAGNAGEGR